MKILGRNTETKLADAQARHAAAQAALADLQSAYDQIDPLSDSFDVEIEKVENQITAQQVTITRAGTQLAALQRRRMEEQAAEKERQRQAAIKTAEALLPVIVADSQAFERAVAQLVRVLTAMDTQRAVLAKAWPSELQAPFDFYFNDAERALFVLREIFIARGPAGKILDRSLPDVCEMADEVTGFADSARKRLAEMIADLRDPKELVA
jgi:predicted  nucleic acid-binding Zn-ribbon protein